MVVQDKEALKWFAICEQNASAVQSGCDVRNGRALRQDDKEAVKWYRKAAEQGDADAQYNLGVMYATVKVSLKTTKKRSSGIARLLNKGDAMRSTIWV